METEGLQNRSDDFASIDELLDDNEDEGELKTTLVQQASSSDSDEAPVGENGGVFSSCLLDRILYQQTKLVGAVSVPSNVGIDCITEVSDNEMEKTWQTLEEKEMLEGFLSKGGKKEKTVRSRMRMMMYKMKDSQKAKPKTLAMKREKLQEDILRYGVAAIESIYPRQKKSPIKRKSVDSRPIFKMKPAPSDLKFEEVDAKQILKPFSHSKYIRQPETSRVVYIHRREGLVPLSSLCQGARTLLSSNVRLLAGRNVRLGKPGHFVNHRGRLLAVGGTRRKENLNIKVVQVPSFQNTKDKMTPFEIDDEFAKHSASAVSTSCPGRVDVRELKRLKKKRVEEIEDKIDKEKTNLDRMVLKLKFKPDDHEIVDNGEFRECMASFQDSKSDSKSKVEYDVGSSVKEEPVDEFKSFHLGRKEYFDSLDRSVDSSSGPEKSVDASFDLMSDSINSETEGTFVIKAENGEKIGLDIPKEADITCNEVLQTFDSEARQPVVRNQWNVTSQDVVPQELNIDECPPLRGYSEGSIRLIKRTPILNFEGYTGYDACDVADCFCKEAQVLEKSTNDSSFTESGTPTTGFHSGCQTPSGTKRPLKIAKDLLRVKRALKTLGVKIIEYDDDDGCEDTCQKEFCKLGCICDSLRTKQIPPSHCGKVECMFACCCSKEALKYSSCGSRRVNISAAVGARIQEASQRDMAVEERKFSNTVVVTSDKNAVVLGERTGRGTRRERKMPQRYQNANTLMLDVTGKEYVKKEESSESEIEYEEEKMEDSYESLLQNEALIPCTVIIPKLALPRSCEVWCMYHCQYSCPCYKFKSPLDYAPDKNASRNVARRTLGNKFSKKRRRSGEKNLRELNVSDDSSDPPLLGIEDIDPDWNIQTVDKIETEVEDLSHLEENHNNEEAPQDIKLPTKYTVKKGHCARTQGAVISRSNRLKMPVTLKEIGDPLANQLPELEEVICVSNSPAKSAITPPPEIKDLVISEELSLEVAPKTSSQYVRWDLFKKQFQGGAIDLWFWVRPGRGKNMVFLTPAGTRPYIATAINIRNLQGSTQNLPGLVDECLRPVRERDQALYVVLESNGSVWALSSIQANKERLKPDQVRAISSRLTTDCKKMVGTKGVTKNAMGPEKVIKEGAVKVCLAEVVQKLPVGQSLITVTGVDSKAMMQVKLPPTLSTQYWSLISVGQGRSSIQCPDSSLVLKCAILQQAATLSTATSTTVRIPIPVGDQDPSFGVYAVPGLKTHVFVGPFACSQAATELKDPEVVCLDDDDDDVMKEGDKENIQDDIKIVEKENDKELAERRNKQKLLAQKSQQLGQVPLRMNKEDADGEVEIIESPDDKERRSQASMLHRQNLKRASEDPVYKLFDSENGQVIKRQDMSLTSTNKGSALKIRHNREGQEQVSEVFVQPSGKVIMAHPEYVNHEVVCSSLQKAKLWLKEFYDQLPKPSGSDNCQSPRKTPPLVLKRIKTPSLPSGRSTENISLFTMQTKQQRDETELFYELGHTAFTSFFRKNISRAQILIKAKEEIESLEEAGKEFEMVKAALLKKRAKLFNDFTKSLNGLPVAKKKAAVIELKELMKKDEAKKANKDESVSEGNNISLKSPKPSSASAPNPETSATPYTDATGIKTVRSDGSILRPMNAFMLWAKEKRVEMISQGMSVSQVSQELSVQWKGMTEEAKTIFYKEAERLKTLHKLQHPDYKYSPHIVRNTTIPQAPQKQVAPCPQSSVAPNQPPDQQAEEIQLVKSPSGHHGPIQVPKPLAQLRNQSIIISRPSRPSTRPTPALIPVQQDFSPPPPQQASGQACRSPAATTYSKPKQQQQFEVLNIPAVPRGNIKISSTFTPQIRRGSVEEIHCLGQERQVDRRELLANQPPPPDTTLNLLDIPQDAADVLGLAVQSSGLEEDEVQQSNQVFEQQYVVQGEQDQDFIQIGGDSYQVMEGQQQVQQPVYVDERGRQVILSAEQHQSLVGQQQDEQFQPDHQVQIVGEQDDQHVHLVEQRDDHQLQLVSQQHNQQVQLVGQHHEQQVQLIGQQHEQQVQLVGQQQDEQVHLVDEEIQQPMFVDEEGRQVILTPEQQMLLQNQQMMLQGSQQQYMMDESGQPVLVTYQEQGDLIYQTEDNVMTIE